MPSRFTPGATVYAKDGRRYVVDEVEDGIAYCRSTGGAETEFPEAQLQTEAEWTARAGNPTDRLYATLRQSKIYAPYKGRLNPAASDRLLAKIDRLVPGILDYVAFVAAERVLADAAPPDLSIVKAREIFDTAPPEARLVVLAGLIGSPPEILLGAVDLGDNLLRAMVEKATTAGRVSFQAFGARRRR